MRHICLKSKAHMPSSRHTGRSSGGHRAMSPKRPTKFFLFCKKYILGQIGQLVSLCRCKIAFTLGEASLVVLGSIIWYWSGGWFQGLCYWTPLPRAPQTLTLTIDNNPNTISQTRNSVVCKCYWQLSCAFLQWWLDRVSNMMTITY